MNCRYNVQRRQNYQHPQRCAPQPRCEESCVSTVSKDTFSSLAMVYPVSQCWRLINDGAEGFERGTIFDELYKPFVGDKCKKGNC
ncbi:MAG: spore coat associated protein CotJA [Clostridia bacterium]|nr:spore coat associated protein CotJA [Clostridia bacterium]